jgi:uncharacterized protein YjbJ (UPF0337 family)
MNWDEVAGKWNQWKGAVKERWGRLTDDDLTVIDGKRDILVGKLQQRYGLAKEQAEEQVNQWKVPPRREESEPKRKVS